MREGLSRDKRRLAAGLLLMALTVGASLVAVFVLGRPAGARVAPGVPFLVASGWALVLGAAVVFYRTYPDPADRGPDGEGRVGSAAADVRFGGRSGAGEGSAEGSGRGGAAP